MTDLLKTVLIGALAGGAFGGLILACSAMTRLRPLFGSLSRRMSDGPPNQGKSKVGQTLNTLGGGE